jgi:hypothetical protein
MPSLVPSKGRNCLSDAGGHGTTEATGAYVIAEDDWGYATNSLLQAMMDDE